MNRTKSLLVWLVIIAIGAFVAEFVRKQQPSRGSAPSPQTGEAISGRARVVDGDSLVIGNQRIRLFGIDTPEGRQECRDAAGRAYGCGNEARRALESLIGSRPVACAPTGQSYDRKVALCRVSGNDLGEGLVRAGHALELRNHSRGRYSAAEREARDARRGLWAGSFERPSEWRRAHPR